MRLIIFLILVIASVQMLNQIFCPIIETGYFAFHDLAQRDDVELAIIGNSIVQTDFNPNIITEITGIETFDISVGATTMPGALTAARIMYQSNQPKYVCLVFEPEMLSAPIEPLYPQMYLMPHAVHPFISIPYYLDLCRQDGMYLERLFLFRYFEGMTWENVKNAIAIRLDTEKYFAQSETGIKGNYRGRGYCREMVEGQGEAILRFIEMRKPIGDLRMEPGLDKYSCDKLLEYKRLCEKNGSQLIVIMAPNMLVNALSKEGYVQKGIELGEFCGENGIPFLNFYLAKKEFIPRLDSYFLDNNHMDYRGADIFSEKFAQVMRDYLDGKEISHYFYQSAEEFFVSIDCITNTWIDEERGKTEDTYIADCLKGDLVVPEYSFYLVEDDGTHHLLQPYSNKATYVCSSGELSGKRLRVYARPHGNTEQSRIFFDIICGER